MIILLLLFSQERCSVKKITTTHRLPVNTTTQRLVICSALQYNGTQSCPWLTIKCWINRLLFYTGGGRDGEVMDHLAPVSHSCRRNLCHPDGMQQLRIISSPRREIQSRQNREASAGTSADLDSYITVSFVWGIYLTGAVSQGGYVHQERDEKWSGGYLLYRLFFFFFTKTVDTPRTLIRLLDLRVWNSTSKKNETWLQSSEIVWLKSLYRHYIYSNRCDRKPY